MRKKYLSALLFGALLFASTGTFTSCKDYDDEINGLQEQVDKLATKEDMEAKLTQMQTAVTSAQTSAQEALTTAQQALETAQQAGDADAIANLETKIADQEKRIAALEEALGDIDALKEELQNTLNGQIDAFRTEMDELVAKVESLVGKLADMVTSVELVYSNTSQEHGYGTTTSQEHGYGTTLNMMSVIEKANVFGEGLPGAMTFTEGAQKQVGSSFIVRVSPTNAVITPEMISLINAKGETLDDFLNIDKVERYNQNILGEPTTPQTRAEGNSGLWKVTVSLKNYDKDSFNAVTMQKDGDVYKHVKFAVEVNNTLTTEATATRDVISAYDLQIGKANFKPLATLNYWVNDKNVTTIRNRYVDSEDGTAAPAEEWKWKDDAADVAPVLTSDGKLETDPTKANAEDASDDNRSGLSYIYPAVQGEAFTVSIDAVSNTTKYGDLKAPDQIKGMYVTLDTRNAVESEPSEINAWKGYSYTGLDQVVEGTSTQIKIDGDNIINDIIGLRVYAVNMDGTLVDPDGRAFYVRLGSAAADWSATNTVITPDAKVSTDANEEKSATQNVTLSKLTGASEMTWTTDKVNNTAPAFHVYFVDKDNNVLYSTANGNSGLGAVAFDKVTKIYTMPTQGDWTLYEDDKAYSGTLTIKNANDFVLATLDVTMTKTLPTTLPNGFSIKTAQVQDGIYNCYLIPDKWDAGMATSGTMKMTEVFNFGDGVESQYNISFATSKKDNNKDVTLTVKGDGSLVVDKAYINNETEHATTVVYNYGRISSKKNAKGEHEDWTVKATDFSTIYNCIYNDTYTWAWANNAQLGGDFAKKDDKGNYINRTPSTTLTYGTDYKMKKPNGTAFSIEEAIFGTSAWDSEYDYMLSPSYNNSLKIVDATLTSNANGEAEYFDVVVEGGVRFFKAIALSSNTNPTADVPSTLNIKVKDMYGHEFVIKLPMTVKKR